MWLLEESIREALHAAPAPTQAQMDAVMSQYVQDDEGYPTQKAGIMFMPPSRDRVMTVTGDVAQIDVVGITTESLDFMAVIMGMGNTLYGDIVEAIHSAEADTNIKRVDFFFRTPGGQASQVPGVGDLIANMQKPTRALVDRAHSAGYWLASQCDTIVANTRGAAVGSIGAVQAFRKPSESMFIEITSAQAPRKRPNPETAEGMAAIREELDVLHTKFAEAVAAGRNTTVENVNQNFGQGGSLLADQALAVGMIDEIAATPTRSVEPSDLGDPEASGNTETIETGAKTMDLAKLKADHPGLYDQVHAAGKAEGVTEGINQERDRVKFHATMGEEVGAIDIALAACKEGTAKDDGVTQAKYLTAARNGSELRERENEEQNLADNKPAASNNEDTRERQKGGPIVVDDKFAAALFERNGVQA
ncbi:peptidase S49 [Vibrio phage CKB-S1]|nr:peptidase S49 [Vibrio phage CKB-S1]